MSNRKIIYTTASDPCKRCGSSSKNCSYFVGDNREISDVNCRGEELAPVWHELRPRDDNDFGLYRYDPEANKDKKKKRSSKPKSKPKPGPEPVPSADPSIDWDEAAERFSSMLKSHPEAVLILSDHLGIPSAILEEWRDNRLIGISGRNSFGFIFTFSERGFDPAGALKTVGIKTREIIDGGSRKKYLPGSDGNGFYLPPRMPDSGPVLVVEGASDVLACSAAGIAAVGRSAAKTSSKNIAQLLSGGVFENRQIIVIGENDQKPGGKWPGRDGAQFSAKSLAGFLRREIFYAFPPQTKKDSREAILSEIDKEISYSKELWEKAGELFTSQIVYRLESSESLIKAESLDPSAESAAESAADSADLFPWDEDSDPLKWSHAPDEPHRLAELFQTLSLTPAGVSQLRKTSAGLIRWLPANAHYSIFTDELENDELSAFINVEFMRCYRLEKRSFETSGDETRKPPVVRPVRRSTVADVAAALSSLVTLIDRAPPLWLDGFPGPNPIECVSFRNGIFHPGGFCSPPTPSYFSYNAVPVNYSPGSSEPIEWLRFLRSVWPEDPAAIDCLQEWLGYLLTSDNRMKKILCLVGPNDSGKSTIVELISKLIPSRCAPSLLDLCSPFGLQSLLGKTLATISELDCPRDIASAAVSMLKRISGNDTVSIPRKFKTQIESMLSTRFVIYSNDPPELADNSGAMSSRLVILRLKQSFENKKDADLPAKLEAELEAIAAWGMIGLARLYKNKSFTASADGQELAQTMKSFSEPIKEFISDCCSVGSDYSVTIDEMYKKFVEWSNESGRKPSDKQRLSRALATAAGVVTRRPGKGNRRQRMYFGIKLRSIYEYDTSEDGSASASSVDASASSVDASASSVDANNPRNDGEIESRPLASASTSTNYYMENEKEGERESSDGEIPVSLNRENSGRKRTADAIADAMKNAEENEQIAFVPPDRVPYFNQSFKHKLLPKSYGESFVIDGVKYYRLNISSYYWYEYNANRINIGSHPSPLDAIKLDAAIRTAMPFFWYWMDRNLEDGQKRALAALREAGAIPTLLEQCGG